MIKNQKNQLRDCGQECNELAESLLLQMWRSGSPSSRQAALQEELELIVLSINAPLLCNLWSLALDV